MAEEVVEPPTRSSDNKYLIIKDTRLNDDVECIYYREEAVSYLPHSNDTQIVGSLYGVDKLIVELIGTERIG